MCNLSCSPVWFLKYALSIDYDNISVLRTFYKFIRKMVLLNRLEHSSNIIFLREGFTLFSKKNSRNYLSSPLR